MLWDLQTLNRLTIGSPPGIWVSSTEMLLRLPRDSKSLNMASKVTQSGVTVIAVPGTVAAAERHGVYGIDNGQFMRSA